MNLLDKDNIIVIAAVVLASIGAVMVGYGIGLRAGRLESLQDCERIQTTHQIQTVRM